MRRRIGRPEMEIEMFGKTALLSGAAVLMLSAAPALAQDLPTQDPTSTPTPATPGTLQIQPGSDVKGSDGAVLGKLEGVRTANGVQQLKVRGSDGVLRGVALNGLKPDGAGVAVAATTSEFQASPPIEEAADETTTPPAPSVPDAAEPDAATPPTT